MTYYEKKRRKIGLTRSELANQLNVDYDRYSSIEKGEVKMPTNLIDKFNEIINKGKQNDIERLNRKQIVEEWFEEMQKNKSKFKEKMKEFNINTYDELGHLLGYANGTIICAYINGTRQCGFDIKNKIYSFFENELNIQKPKERKYQRVKTEKDKELYEWYKSFDVNKWLREHDYTVASFSREFDITQSAFYYFCHPLHEDFRPYIKTIVAVKKAIEEVDGEEVLAEGVTENEKTESDSTKDTLIEKYETKAKILEMKVKEITNQINDLNGELTDILHTKKIYEELLEELQTL